MPTQSAALYFTVQGEGQPLIIIHGLFGSADNWRTLAKKFAEQYQVFCVDLRNHGRSPHIDGMSYAEMANDLLAFMDQQQIAKAHILGHSMGGKVAMQLALNHPERVSHLVVADIAPVAYQHGHDDVLAAFDAVQALGGVASRKDADEVMSAHVDSLGVRQFLMTNLEKQADGRLGWRVGLAQIKQGYADVIKAPEGNAFTGKTLFIRGELSAYVLDQYQAALAHHFPNYRLDTLPETGHWLHAEKPLLFLQQVSAFLNS